MHKIVVVEDNVVVVVEVVVEEGVIDVEDEIVKEDLLATTSVVGEGDGDQSADVIIAPSSKSVKV